MKIWFCVVEYIFEFENFYIKLEIESSKDLPVAFDEYHKIMVAKIKRIDEKYTPYDGSVLITKDDKIKEIFVVTTLIYFFDYRDKLYKGHENFGYFGDFLINPKSKLGEEIHPKITNLVHVGLLLKTSTGYIDSFIRDNNDDFDRYDEIYLLSDFDLNDLSQPYTYYKINDS